MWNKNTKILKNTVNKVIIIINNTYVERSRDISSPFWRCDDCQPTSKNWGSKHPQ